MPFFGSREMCPACQKQTAPYREKYADLHHEDKAAEGLITKGLVVLNVAVFVMMVLNGVSPVQPAPGELFRWGSEFGPYTLTTQPWRLLTCMFLHIGIIHLAFNMWCLWDLGQVAERIFGRAWFLVLYLASGVCGSYLSLLWNPMRNSAGASGAIFGICGALIAAFKFGHLGFDPTRVRGLLRSVSLFAIYNLLFGLAGGINNMAHLGGLIGGFLIGFVLTRLFPPYSTAYKASLYWLTPILAAALAGGYFGLRDLKADQLAIGQGLVATEPSDCSKVIPQLEHAVTSDPKDVDGHATLGFCYEKVGRADDAQREYERAIAIGSNDPFIHQQLGWIVGRKGDYAAMEQHFRQALQQDAKDDELNRGLAVALWKEGKAGEAIKYAEQSVASGPREPKNQEALGDVYMANGRYRDAVKAFQQVTSLDPNNPNGHRELADAYEKSGDAKSAADERAKAAQLENSRQK